MGLNWKAFWPNFLGNQPDVEVVKATHEAPLNAVGFDHDVSFLNLLLQNK